MKPKHTNLFLSFLLASLTGSTFAVANDWLGTTDASWNTPDNWSSTATPIPTDTVTYIGTDNLTQTLDASFAVAGIGFGAANTTAQAYVINTGTGTNTLTLGTGGINTAGFDSSDSLTLNAGIVLGDNQFWKVRNTSAAADLTVSGVIGGSGSLTLDWASTFDYLGTVVFTGVNTYTGVTTIRGSGTVGATDGNSCVKVTTIGNGGVAGNLGQASNAAANLVLGTNGHSAGQLNYGGTGESTDRLFTLDGHGAIANNGTGALNFTNTGSIAHGSGSHSFTLGGSNTANNTFAPIIGNGSGTVNFTKADAGTWVLTGANIYTGTTTLTGGTLSVATIGNGSAAGNLGAATTAAGNLVFNGGTLLFTGTSDTSDRNFTINAGKIATIIVNPGKVLTLSGGSGVTTTGGFTMDTVNAANGTGKLILSGTNSWTGVTTIKGSNTTTPTTGQSLTVSAIGNGGIAGNLGAATNLASNLVFGQTGSSTGQLNYVGIGESTDRLFTLNGHAIIMSNGTGALNFTNTGSIGHLGGSHGLTLAGANTAANTFTSIIANGSGTTSFAKDGAGTWILTGTNTFTGVTTLTGGTLSVSTIGDGGVAGNLGQGTNVPANLVFNGGTLLFTGTSASSNRNFTINAGKTAIISVASGKALTLSGAAGATTGGFTKDNQGQLILSGTSSWTGVTTIRGATTTNVNVGQSVTVSSLGNGGVAGNLGAGTSPASNLVFGQVGVSAGQLNYVGAGESTDRLFTLSGNAVIMNNGSGALNFTNVGTIAHPTGGGHGLTLAGANTAENTLASIIADGSSAISLTKADAGKWVLTGNNTYTGNTTVNGGTLSLATASLADASTVSIASGATLDLTHNSTDTISKLFINGVQQPAGTYKSDTGAGVGTVLASLAGSGMLQVTNGPINTFASWIGGFGFSAFPGANLTANGDADGDGISNLVEEVFGTPANAATTGLTQIGATASTLTFKHPLNANPASDVTYSYQWSSDLGEWKNSGQANTGGTTATITAGVPVAGEVTVTTTISGGPATKLFVRVVANQAP